MTIPTVQRALLLLILLGFFCAFPARSHAEPPKTVLVLVEGSSSLKNPAMGLGRQLGALLGHFNTTVTIKGVNDYTPREMYNYEYIFYNGFRAVNPVPAKFADDVMRMDKRIIWLSTGFREFSSRPGVAEKFGFVVTSVDSVSRFNAVKFNQHLFVKGEPNINVVQLARKNPAVVVATASSSRTRKELPYIVQRGLFTYFADSPFSYADEGSTYLLFADMLHDILQEQHEESHSALIRIEDVNPMENPEKLREIADLLSSRNIPFLVGVIPFYVNPNENVRVSLSDKPDVVDALKYMVQNGGTIVMHGVTHQYKGVTASDFEFWDENTNSVIKGETAEGIAHKLETGIQEFMKNGLYPLVWETPHYTASFLLYQTVAKYFSTAMEQRLAIEDFDYGQFFPYVIHKDLFGQTIYPENLGYVPLDPDRAKSEASVRAILDGARNNLYVRDGFASNFFHAFVDLDLLAEIVDSIQAMGYTYMDMRDQTHWVKMKDRVILCGSQPYTITLDDQYLSEGYFGRDGDLVKRSISPQRLKGSVTREITLEPGQFYKAEPTEFTERPLTLVDQVMLKAKRVVDHVFSGEESWHQARPVILWNYHARGAAYNDQASFASVFKSVNINVDTVFVGQELKLAPYNLVIVPQAFVDSLQSNQYDILRTFVEAGGNLITDGKSDLAEDLGVKFSDKLFRISRVRDKYFPEERISWRYPELASRIDAPDIEEVFCQDEVTEAPLAIGKKLDKGKIIFFTTRFDPQSQLGYSQYPYLLEYVRKYFHLGPVIRRDGLEVFFEPGSRRTVSTETLVKQWVAQGVRVIHAAGWHQWAKYTYDYARLVSLAHANGILVYAWIEPPQVSQKFWQDHPQWREKNYKGEDVRPSWRYPVALTDPKCVDAMVNEYQTLLQSYDWDGVNLAELYFEAARGLEDPEQFTPMHPSAREAMRRKYGIDLAAIFDRNSPWYWRTNPEVKHAVTEYRVAKLHEVYERMLKMFDGIETARPGFQVVVTAMDSYGSPELRDYLGVDMNSILSLQKTYGFNLSVEDPELLWSTTPLRYLKIGRIYAALTGDSSKVMLDLNILDLHERADKVTPFPTLIQTGTECFQLVHAAAEGAPRMVIYSESSINPQDFIFLPYALAEGVDYRPEDAGYLVRSPYSFTVKLPSEFQEVHIDGMPLSPARENTFIVPAGEHHLEFHAQASNLSSNALQPRILSFTGNLLSVAYNNRTMEFTYESAMRVLLSINREPTQVRVDNVKYPFTAMKGNDGFALFLPQGNHSVTLEAGDPFTYGVSLTSFWSTTAIAMFGSVAIALLLLMYLLLVFVRRRHSAKPHGGAS
jgi:uncharacterized protein YdaL